MNRHKMTLDEAIENAEEKAEEIRNEAEHYEIAGVNIYGCEERAQEWEQFSEWLKELKRLREQEKWIPVSERLPEESEDVLTCGNGGFIEIQSIEKFYDFYWENQKVDWTDFDEVIAWMPLPAPYKAESEKV